MKIRVVLTIAIVVTAAAAALGSDISISDVTGTWVDGMQTCVNPGCLVSATFRLTNTSGSPITGSTSGFVAYLAEGGVFTYVDADTLPIGWSQYYDGGVFAFRDGIDWLSGDTVGFGGFALTGPGLPSGFSEDVWYISVVVSPADAGKHLCFDTAFFPPGGTWLWATNRGQIIPDWYDTPVCYEIKTVPCGWVTFGDTIAHLEIPANAPFSQAFVASNPLDYMQNQTLFDVIGGRGSIESINDSTGIWHYTPTAGDIGRTDTLLLQATDCGSCAYKVVTLHFYCETPSLSFGEGCTVTPTVLSQGESTSHSFTVDPCCPPLFVSDNGGAPAGVCAVTGSTVSFNSTADCRGFYQVKIGQTNGTEFAYCSMPVMVTDTVCFLRGNVDGRRNPEAVNVADLTYLVNYLFKGGMLPANMDEGNVDATYGIVVSDLTYLVNFLFRGGPQPPVCQ